MVVVTACVTVNSVVDATVVVVATGAIVNSVVDATVVVVAGATVNSVSCHPFFISVTAQIM